MSTRCTVPPGNKVSANIEEDEEALVVGSEGSVGAQASSLLPQALQIDDMQVDLLGDGRRRHGVGDHASGRPSPAVHIKVPGQQREGDMLGLIRHFVSCCSNTGHSISIRLCLFIYLWSGERPIPIMCPWISMTWSRESKNSSELRSSPRTGPEVVIWSGLISLIPGNREQHEEMSVGILPSQVS